MTWFGCHEFFFSTGSASRVVRADGICYLRFYISLSVSALLLGLGLLLLFTAITCWGSLGRLIEDRGSGRRLPKFGPRQFPTPLFVHPPQLWKTTTQLLRAHRISRFVLLIFVITLKARRRIHSVCNNVHTRSTLSKCHGEAARQGAGPYILRLLVWETSVQQAVASALIYFERAFAPSAILLKRSPPQLPPNEFKQQRNNHSLSMYTL